MNYTHVNYLKDENGKLISYNASEPDMNDFTHYGTLTVVLASVSESNDPSVAIPMKNKFVLRCVTTANGVPNERSLQVIASRVTRSEEYSEATNPAAYDAILEAAGLMHKITTVDSSKNDSPNGATRFITFHSKFENKHYWFMALVDNMEVF